MSHQSANISQTKESRSIFMVMMSRDWSSLDTQVLNECLYGVKEERVILLAELTRLKMKRETLERTLGQVQSRYSHLKDTHDKMQETLKRVKFQFDEVQSEIGKLDAPNKKLKENIDELNKCIEQEEQNRISDQMAFEKDLSSISELFNDSQNFYDTENLQRECDAVNNDIDLIDESVVKGQQQLETLITDPKSCQSDDVIDEKLLNLWSDMKEINSELHLEFSPIERNKKDIQEKVNANLVD